MALSIQHWVKTQEAELVIDSQKIFCIGGILWQAHGRTPFKVEESDLTSEEMADVNDIDNTMQRQWKIRRDRIVARMDRKNKEYRKIRSVLREEKNKIRESLKGDKELGMDPSEADLEEIRDIDKRMLRLRDLGQETDREIALVQSSTKTAEAAPEPEPEAPAEQMACPYCQSKSPPGHKNPKAWISGHQMQCKARKEAKAS